MVAALYGYENFIEVALALPEDAEDPLLEDASHLTWRTLPVAAVLRKETDIKRLSALAKTAVDRVKNATHDVERGNDFFVEARRERVGQRPRLPNIRSHYRK